MDTSARINRLIHTATWFLKASYEDMDNSYDVFAKNVFDALGGPYCISAGLRYQEAVDMVRSHNSKLSK